jgi:hypothetical protein
MGGDGGRRVGFVSRSGVSWPYRRTDIERKGNKTKKKKKKKEQRRIGLCTGKTGSL